MSVDVLPFAHGGPPLRGALRVQPGDFFVDEILGFEPEGSGEHVFVHVEKTGTNSDWVGKQLARFAGVAPMAVSWSGMKDRHAVTRQWFSVQLPGKTDLDWLALNINGVQVLDARRHNRKLKRGAHRGNQFRIRLRDVSGDREAAQVRIDVLAAQGVPNYFGEQRFGRGGDNLDLARALFAGRRLPREQRSFALSAARSHLFNRILAARVVDGSWSQAHDGDVFMLAGTHSVFGPEPVDDALRERMKRLDIHPTGALWGRGQLRSSGAVGEREASIAAADADLAAGLVKHELDQQRRSLRLLADGFSAVWEDADLILEFDLESGAFATVVIRELCDTGTMQSSSLRGR